MAFRLRQSVVRVELDNRERGRVSGEIWVMGRDEPICLQLRGDCLKDIAGCHVILENPSPESQDDANSLASLQEGTVGDMTASRRVRVLNCTLEEARRIRESGEDVPLHTGNSVYLEWFSDTNGRVVIESADYRIKSLSEPTWCMSGQEEEQQARNNLQAIKDWMQGLSEKREAQMVNFDEEEYRPMDEFDWERSLKESDALTDKYSAALEKYVDHPDREKLIAREMGWNWLDDALDADERGAFEEEKQELGDLPGLEPIPEGDGVDWMRTDDGHVTHPLTHRASNTAMSMWHYCKERGLLGENGDSDLHEMIFQAQTLGAKLAGALGGLAYDDSPEGGFIVACLKRALKYFGASINASEKVRGKGLVDSERLEQFRSELFCIREEMLKLMKRFRQKFLF